ncbi:helix-turn-helix transcriptional regulator [Flavobacterium piscis]|uniref:Transcriptional regulator with XRE-family HTH domain n=1 Tax=Flavobacterium piscis TaxID=1114874 RepID=A0ABU1Y6B5_9FLAO|nr:helix-turn-helix transcriptional regulator [Flavobacterium piscis]MDR7209781.1 transcriptional regulator with XRE-family HTH domain [Flavobacterium piscis]
MNAVIGNKLKQLRKNKGMSQEQVADYLHVSQSAYARMESGESHSWASHINDICQVFEIAPEELVKSEGVVINNNQQGGGGYIQIVNQLSEKLIDQYEERIKELKEVIEDLRTNKKG